MPPKLFDDSDDEGSGGSKSRPAAKPAHQASPTGGSAPSGYPPPLADDDDDDNIGVPRAVKKPSTLYSDGEDEGGSAGARGGTASARPAPKVVPRALPKLAHAPAAHQEAQVPPSAVAAPAAPAAVAPTPVAQPPPQVLVVQAQQQQQAAAAPAPSAYPPPQPAGYVPIQPAPSQPQPQMLQPSGYPPQHQQQAASGYPPPPPQVPHAAQYPPPPQQQQQQLPMQYPPQQYVGAPPPQPHYPPQPLPAPVVVVQPQPPPPPPAPQNLPRPPMPKAPQLPLVGGPAELPAFQNAASLAREQAGIDASAWEAFQQLRKQLEESHSRTVALHAQISQLQLSHEKEAQQFRDAAHKQQEQLRREWETVTEHYNQAQAKVDNMTSILNRQAENIMKKDLAIHELTAANAAMVQNVAHVEDRAKLADNARQVAEVRQRELELSLDHSTNLVNSLRAQLSVAHEEKVHALQTQYANFQLNREEIIKFYADREVRLLDGYNEALNAVQLHMEANIHEREEKATKFWQDILKGHEEQLRALQKEFEDRAKRHEIEVETLKAKQEEEKERWTRHLKQEIYQLEQRHKEREEQVLADIARRERDLSEREQRARVQRVQDEQDAKVALLSKEAELKAYYEKQMDDMRRGHEMDRERLTSAFREQLAAISAQHLTSERELEKLHRDKEREMAQRYRVAGYEAEDAKAATGLKDVTAKTQTSLLSKFENIEARQRERAEQSRSAFRGSTSFSNVANTPSNASLAQNPSSPTGGGAAQ